MDKKLKTQLKATARKMDDAEQMLKRLSETFLLIAKSLREIRELIEAQERQL